MCNISINQGFDDHDFTIWSQISGFPNCNQFLNTGLFEGYIVISNLIHMMYSILIRNTSKFSIQFNPNFPSNSILLSLIAPIVITLVLSLFTSKPDTLLNHSITRMTLIRLSLSAFRNTVVSSAYWDSLFSIAHAFIPQENHSYGTRNATSSLLSIPKCNKSIGQKCISYSGSKVWSGLTEAIRCAPSLPSFKSRYLKALYRTTR